MPKDLTAASDRDAPAPSTWPTPLIHALAACQLLGPKLAKIQAPAVPAKFRVVENRTARPRPDRPGAARASHVSVTVG